MQIYTYIFVFFKKEISNKLETFFFLISPLKLVFYIFNSILFRLVLIKLFSSKILELKNIHLNFNFKYWFLDQYPLHYHSVFVLDLFLEHTIFRRKFLFV